MSSGAPPHAGEDQIRPFTTSRASACAWALACVLVVGCAEPPNKEMDQAQGAIDAARAAGADQYAKTEYDAATTTLQSSHDAVAAGDYRLALNYALESREHAQNAARDTAETKARMRSNIERTLAELDALIAKGQAQIAAAERARVPPRTLRQPAADLKAAVSDLQKPRAAVAQGDYLAADDTLKGIKARVEKVLMALNAATTSQTSRRRR
jgi:uncharacterized protein DUF4398